MATSLESQVSQDDDGTFRLTITISSGDNYWTTSPAELASGTWRSALAEAREKADAFATVLGLDRS